ncbi:MAG: hypothetical protein O2856_00530 [Planctomycetota bacterium]|nr:hypothetical protein [Planctomycetota bacterium]
MQIHHMLARDNEQPVSLVDGNRREACTSANVAVGDQDISTKYPGTIAH